MIPQNGAAKIHTGSFETNSGEEITCSVYSSFQLLSSQVQFRTNKFMLMIEPTNE